MRARDGFTLLEVLVALAILGLSMTTATAIISHGWSRLAEDDAQFRAILDADVIAARIGLDIPPDFPGQSGDLPDGASYRVDIAPYPWPAATSESPLALRRAELRQVTVSVSGPKLPDGYKLQTLIVVPRGSR